MSKESAQTALGKFAEAVNTGNFDLFDQVVANNCVDHDPADGQVPGPAGYRMFFSGMRTALPDMSVIRSYRTRTPSPSPIPSTARTPVASEKSRPLARRSRSAACRSLNSKMARWSNVGEAPMS